MKKYVAILLAAILLCSSSVSFAIDFSDLTDAHAWAKADIENYAKRDIVAGDGNGNFMPDNHVTRAEFAKMLCLVFALDTMAEIEYTDVDKDSWKYDYIAKTDAYVYMSEAGIYAPDTAATRAEIAYAIVNAAGFEATETELPFSDRDVVVTAMATQVKAAYAIGLLKGYPDNTFRPSAPVSRAEVVVLLARAEKALKSQAKEDVAQKEPVKEPEKENVKEEAVESIKISPMETLCYMESADKVLHPTKDEICLRLKFRVGANAQVHTLYAAENVPVYNVDGTITTLKMGDVVCIDTNLYGAVTKVYVILRMGDTPLLSRPTTSETAFLQMLYVPTANKWGYLDDDTKHEVYLGFIGDVIQNDDQTHIVIYPSNGVRNTNAERIVTISGDTRVTCYTTNARVKKRYSYATVDTMEYYTPNKDNHGNLLWESSADTEYMQYVFVKTLKDTITDLIIISNR